MHTISNELTKIAIRFLVLAVVGSSAVTGTAQSGDSSSSSDEIADQRKTVSRYCVTCHNAKRNTANINLEDLNFEDVAQHGELWEKMVHKIRTGDMPPPGKRQPSRRARKQLLEWMISSLDSAAVEHPNPGRPAVHRLNRAEYANAIRDLLNVEIDVKTLLPADGTDYGFDNIADSLNMSPLLLERYMMAASKVTRLAIGDEDVRSSTKIYKVSKLLVQNDRMSEDLPFGSRGGHSVRHFFPADGEYTIKVRVQSPNATQARDVYQRSPAPEQLDVRVDGTRVGQFTISPPEGGGYSYLTLKYKQDKQGEADTTGSGARTFDTRFSVKAGTRTVAVSFLKRTLAYEGVRPDALPAFYTFGDVNNQLNSEPGVIDFQVSGPLNVAGVGELASRDAIFTKYPESRGDEPVVAREILSRLARRAYRRPVTDRDMEALIAFYKSGYREGGFESGIRFAIERILVSPSFLFRIEIPPEGSAPKAVFELSDLDLASRLSFFLWSSIPDEELLSIAERGELRNPTVLEQQVRRMLSDERSESLAKNFGAQWLHLRNVDAITPDVKTFPQFDDNLRAALRRETELFFLSQLREDRPVTELLSADYTYVNERLAKHYGIPNVIGNRFRRVRLSDSRRNGILGHGSILTVTSYATRTSPVRRGKWLLENVLGSPPPPPPADVPDLPEVGAAGESATMRERMEAHLKDPTCASCHVKLDPLGFALENFNAIGQWRTHDAGLPVDAMGELPDGTVMNGPEMLRDVLLQRQEEFVRTVTQKLLTYALGRGIQYYDQPSIREITAQGEAGNLNWSTLILAIVNSKPFRMRASS